MPKPHAPYRAQGLPDISTFPYDEYIRQLPYSFIGDNEEKFKKMNGRDDLTESYKKDGKQWIKV